MLTGAKVVWEQRAQHDTLMRVQAQVDKVYDRLLWEQRGNVGPAAPLPEK